MVKANKNDMTASTLVSSIIIVIKITNWKRKYTLPNHNKSRPRVKSMADKDGDQVQHNPEHHCNNLHVEEGKDQVKLNPERHDDHFQGGEGEDQIQLPPEKHVDHLHAEEGEY